MPSRLNDFMGLENGQMWPNLFDLRTSSIKKKKKKKKKKYIYIYIYIYMCFTGCAFFFSHLFIFATQENKMFVKFDHLVLLNNTSIKWKGNI